MTRPDVKLLRRTWPELANDLGLNGPNRCASPRVAVSTSISCCCSRLGWVVVPRASPTSRSSSQVEYGRLLELYLGLSAGDVEDALRRMLDAATTADNAGVTAEKRPLTGCEALPSSSTHSSS